MIPIVRTHRKTPFYLNNLLYDEYCGGKAEQFQQKINVVENENNFRIDLIAPGFAKDELKVSVDKNRLSIKSSTPNNEETEKKVEYLRQEFFKKPFSRAFELPENVDIENIEASHKNGILSITIAKKAKVEIPVQEIEVK